MNLHVFLDGVICNACFGTSTETLWSATLKLAALTYKVFEDKGQINSSGAYQGANYWQFNGKKLKDLADKL